MAVRLAPAVQQLARERVAAGRRGGALAVEQGGIIHAMTIAVAGEPFLLHTYPAHSPDYHQQDKRALCRGPAVSSGVGRAGDA
jgi:hypothetical protein